MHTFYYDNFPCYIFFCGSCICWLSMVLFHWHNSCYVLLIVVYAWERVRAKQKIKIKESHGFPNVRFGGSLKSHIPEHQKNKTNADYNTVCMWSAYFYRNESKKWWTVSNKSRCNEAYFFPANSLSYSLNIHFLSRFIWICYHFFSCMCFRTYPCLFLKPNTIAKGFTCMWEWIECEWTKFNRNFEMFKFECK